MSSNYEIRNCAYIGGVTLCHNGPGKKMRQRKDTLEPPIHSDRVLLSGKKWEVCGIKI